jgi:hypothetical protein
MASKKGDIEIGKRMVEELHRIFDTQKQACTGMRCNRRSFYEWGTVGKTPCGLHLARLHYCGGDVIYVLTGKRSV